MTPDQGLVAYLTIAILTFCFLGATHRLPGQRTFRSDTRLMAAAALARRGVEALPTRRDLLRSGLEGVAHVLLAVALWPLYWLFVLVHSIMATVRVNRGV